MGVLGAWFTQDAFRQYLDATEAFTDVSMEYEPGSFVWLDPEFDVGQAQLTIINDSSHDVVVDHMRIFLDFDGEFAGAHYDPWEDVEIAAGERHTFTAEFTITANSIQHRGGEAELRIRGTMGLEFEEIEEPYSVRFQGDIGQVGWTES
jgi:hypothetical protein